MKSHVSALPSGPRRPDAYQMGKIKEASLDSYRRALQPFISYLIEKRYAPSGAEQFDDLLVEFRNDCSPSKSSFEACVAAVEFVTPSFRGRLPWSVVGREASGPPSLELAATHKPTASPFSSMSSHETF